MVKNSRRHRVAVSGMGGCSAAGKTVPEIHTSLEQGIVNCVPVPESLFRSRLTYPVFAYDHMLPSRRTIQLLGEYNCHCDTDRLNRTVLLTLEALAEALDDAALDPVTLRSNTIGIALGTTVGCTFHDEDYFINWRQGKTPDPEPVFQYLESNLAAFLQNVLGVSGPVAVVTNACASGTDAIGIASGWLDQGICDIAIAGGADALSRIAYYGFASLMLLSQEPCTPFDKDRTGLNLGEGAALLIMERANNITKRNIPIKALVRGYSAASDCYHPTAPHPEGRGLQLALQQALAEAELKPQFISYINAHGTGTNANDSAEMRALKVLGLTTCPVVSTKGITGHMLGAAGAMEAILTILALQDQKTPGTVSCRTPDTDLAHTPLPDNKSVSLRGKVGISQSLAFGGTNSAVILEAV